MSPAYFRYRRALEPKVKEIRSRQEAGEKVRLPAKEAPANGTWWLRYRDSAGTEVREPCTARLETEALSLLREKQTRAERIRSGLEASDLTIVRCDKLFALYLAAHKHLGSQGPMRSQVKRWFTPHMGKLSSAEVLPAHCEALLRAARDAGQAPATVRQLHIRGRLIFKWAQHSLRAVRENPWESVARPSVPHRKVVYLTHETVRALLDGAGEWRLLLTTALHTGMRRSELRKLRWADIAWTEGAHGVIHLGTTKSGEAQAVPLHPDLRGELLEAFKSAGGEFVFPAPRRGGERHESWHVTKLLRNIAERAGIALPPGFTFHGLRKTFVTHLLAATGGNMHAAQRAARHSTPQVTARYYAGTDMEALAAEVAKLSLVSARHADGTPSAPAIPLLPRSKKKA